MAVWIDENKQDALNGCLMVLNIGEDNFYSLPNEYREKLVGAVSDAHADGCYVVYAFDQTTGPFRIPDECSNMEGVDHLRMMFDVCGRRDSNFTLAPDERTKEFQKIKDIMLQHQHFQFRKNASFKICGKISIDGTPVLLPVSNI